MPTVLVTRRLPPPGTAALRDAGVEVRESPSDAPLDRGELLVGVRDVDALLCMLTDRVDAEVFDAAPSLSIVANFAVGFDNVDVAEAARRGIVVTNTPDVLTEATADLAWALLLAAARRVGEGDRLVRTGSWTGWSPTQLLGAPVHGATLGIVGLGRIGTAVARRARGFDMDVCYTSRRRHEAAEAETGARYVTLGELLRTSDVVSLHAPLGETTRHLIDEAALGSMKPTAVLVNTARGALVDEDALVRALRDGTIAAAGLDVFEHEPALAAGLRDLPNVVLAPHIGSATTQARAAMVKLCCENIVRVLAGRPPLTPVRPEATG
ncbi:2-hydroxyacid dehydrogenase [Rhabdothermincola sediminis]|uniref:2-hydroxyacid dehydrogenase n=1 Tax=Rhabdothermincola sediminis TaxID=2751370 RepID=UPI001AA00E4A|nr:D-glycerate dehydrogenase [Rhabdothermincola sediminis]